MARRDREDQGNAPRRSGGSGVGFHTGSLGSPFQLEYYGDSGKGAPAGSETSVRVGSGAMQGRVRADYDRNGSARNRGGAR